MIINVLYIALGKYEVLWDEFYESAKKHFFKGHEVKYFVFTDSKRILNTKDNNLFVIQEKNYGWPGNTLYRFKFFSNIKEKLKNSDYTFFFNANAKFVRDIDSEYLLDENEEFIVAKHFAANNVHKIKRPYSRNKKSTAYVKYGFEGKYYVQACFFGARTTDFIKCCNILSENVEIDESKGVCAVWHDESHFNKYIIEKKLKYLPYSYVYPEVLNLPGKIDLLMRSKEKYADLNSLRGNKKNMLKTITKKIINQIEKVKIEIIYLFKKGKNNDIEK